jgi:hypothetical protein
MVKLWGLGGVAMYYLAMLRVAKAGRSLAHFARFGVWSQGQRVYHW